MFLIESDSYVFLILNQKICLFFLVKESSWFCFLNNLLGLMMTSMNAVIKRNISLDVDRTTEKILNFTTDLK